MYKKILNSIRLCSLIAVILTAVLVFFACFGYFSINLGKGTFADLFGSPHSFTRLILLICVTAAAGYAAAVIMSSVMAKKIIKPIEEIDLSAENHGNIYDELSPLINRIERQNREISRQMDRVKRQKNRLYVVGEGMNEGLVVFDNDGNILFLNSGAEKIFGVTDDVIGGNFFQISRNVKIFDTIEQARTGEKTTISEEIGSKLYHIYLSPAMEKDRVNSIIMLILDISEIEKSEKIRREFTANVSHELKTPLTTILGYSQIINTGIAKPEDIAEFTNRIEKETTRLITLVDDIMKLSRLDEGSETGEFTEIHLLDIAKDVAERLAHRAEVRNISLSCTGEDTIINGDLSQITELVYNLTDNAIKYNRDGGSVTLNIGEGSISVSDTGIGIPEKYQDRIYERFFRVDKSHSKKIGGTGLGLSIVKHIARCHNASISLESLEGEGTTFTVSFPKQNRESAAAK